MPDLRSAFSALLVASSVARAQTACEFQKFVLDVPATQFYPAPASSVDIDGERAVVSGEGRAYVYDLQATQWVLSAVLLPTRPSVAFGRTVALQGDTVVVGAPRDEAAGYQAGAVFVFELQGAQWLETGELAPTSAGPGRGFGHSIALDGDVIVVGAPGYGHTPGSVCVFERASGGFPERTAELAIASGYVDDSFGVSVALDGNRLVICDSDSDQQVAYVYERGTQPGSPWTITAELSHTSLQDDDYFGTSVAVSGDTVVVGAPWHDYLPSTTYAGAAFVYDKIGSEWVFRRKLVNPPHTFMRTLGTAVAIEGDVILVGAAGMDLTWGSGDDAYVFRRNPNSGNWPDTASAVLSGVQVDDDFGHAVAISGDRGIIGAPFHRNDGDDWIGAAYITCLSEVGERVCAVSNEGDLRITGSQVAADEELILTVRRGWGRGYFLMGNGTGVVDPPGFKHLCLAGGPSGVLRIDQPMYDPHHRLELTLDLGAVRGLPGGVLAGETWRFQAWWYSAYYYQGAFSNAVSVTFQ